MMNCIVTKSWGCRVEVLVCFTPDRVTFFVSSVVLDKYERQPVDCKLTARCFILTVLALQARKKRAKAKKTNKK